MSLEPFRRETFYNENGTVKYETSSDGRKNDNNYKRIKKMKEETILKIGDRVTIVTTSKIDDHPLENDPKYNPWGIGGTVKQIWNPKMPELPYLVIWDTGYTNSYAKENLTKI